MLKEFLVRFERNKSDRVLAEYHHLEYSDECANLFFFDNHVNFCFAWRNFCRCCPIIQILFGGAIDILPLGVKLSHILCIDLAYDELYRTESDFCSAPDFIKNSEEYARITAVKSENKLLSLTKFIVLW